MFEIVMGIDDFLIQLVKYWSYGICHKNSFRLDLYSIPYFCIK